VKNISCAGHYAAATLFQGERCARFESTATPSPPPLPRRGEQQFSFGTNSQQRTSARRSPLSADRPRQQLHIRREVRAFARRRLLIQVVPTDN
jgi:hypothetical protein